MFINLNVKKKKKKTSRYTLWKAKKKKENIAERLFDEATFAFHVYQYMLILTFS